MAAETITRVTYRWDDQPGVTPGWYAETWDDRRIIDDSQKVWFPVTVDDYGHDQEGALRDALCEAFPGADIEAL